MTVNLGGLEMKNPVTVASGTFAAGREYTDFVERGVPGRGHDEGRVPERLGGQRRARASPRRPAGMLNSIGLQNPGVAHLKEHDLPWLASAGRHGHRERVRPQR